MRETAYLYLCFAIVEIRLLGILLGLFTSLFKSTLSLKSYFWFMDSFFFSLPSFLNISTFKRKHARSVHSLWPTGYKFTYLLYSLAASCCCACLLCGEMLAYNVIFRGHSLLPWRVILQLYLPILTGLTGSITFFMESNFKIIQKNLFIK